MPTTGERFERAVSIMARLARSRRMSLGPRADLRHHQALHAGRNLRGARGHRCPRLGRADRRTRRPAYCRCCSTREMAAEESHFSIDDVLDRLSNKLVDRHPHVFGDVKADTPGEVLRNWQALKAEEKKKRSRRAVEAPRKTTTRIRCWHGVSSAMPALMEAYKISSRVAQVGFDWPNIEELFDKLHEETDELQQNLEEYPAPGPQPAVCEPVCGRARGKDSRRTACAFGRRSRRPVFRAGEHRALSVARSGVGAAQDQPQVSPPVSNISKTSLRQQGRKPPDASLEEMESLWQESKQQEKP